MIDEQTRLTEIRVRAKAVLAVLARLAGCKGEVAPFVQAELHDARETLREIIELTTNEEIGS